MASIPAPPTKPNVGLRVLLGLVGLVIVALTGAAVIAVSTEEPTRRPQSLSTAKSDVPSVTPTESAPAPTTITIGDTDPALAPAPVVTPAPAPTPAPPPVVTAKPKARPVAVAKDKDAPATSTTSSLKGLAPPPNPF